MGGSLRLALCTTVYPGVEPYVDAWAASVAAQTDGDFEIWVASDGFNPNSLRRKLGGRYNLTVCDAVEGDTPASLRSRLFERMTASVDAVVMTDSDDTLEPARVEAARRMLEGADVAGCSLSIIDREGRFLGPVFGPEGSADWRKDLLRHNVFGLSNSAFRSETLRACLPVPREAVLIDWYLITLAADQGARVAFDTTPLMRYRQYQGNTASVLPPFARETVERSTEVVLGHYELLLRQENRLSGGLAQEIMKARGTVESFRSAFLSDESFRGRYLQSLNALEPRFVWWWCVANSQLEHLWKR
jgi:hypothetical protein